MKNLSLLFKELKFDWRDQPGLTKQKISEGFLEFKKAIAKSNKDPRLLLLQKIAEELSSFHAASLYCAESLKNLEIESKNFDKTLQALTDWYLRTAQIHGSPTFLHLGIIYLDFALLTGRPELYEQAYLYAKLGVSWLEFCNAAMYNAYVGNGFSSSNKVFATPKDLESACLKEIKKVNKDFMESKFEKIVQEKGISFLEVIKTYTKKEEIINLEL